jgi:RHS repeat-associated protein
MINEKLNSFFEGRPDVPQDASATTRIYVSLVLTAWRSSRMTISTASQAATTRRGSMAALRSLAQWALARPILSMYDGLNPVQEKNGGTVTANLLTGLGIDEFFTRTDGVGSRALLPDALGSPVALGDNTGTLQTQYTYEPFGYASTTGQANSSSYIYTGREDDGSGLYYYRARYYHPRLQRFISEDPMEFLGNDVNMYAYVGNSPIRFFDPLGWLRWNKNQPMTVPVTGQTLTNLQCVEKCLQQQTNNPSLDLLMTGGAEKKRHTPGSHHYIGEACDIAGPAFNPVTGNQVLDCASRCGFGAGQFEDYPGVNRDHWHLQIYPGNGVPPLPSPAPLPQIQPGQTP